MCENEKTFNYYYYYYLIEDALTGLFLKQLENP